MSLIYRMGGLDRFLRSVERKQKSVRIAVDKELSKSAARIERQAKILAPVDTGWLRAQIYSEQQRLLHYRVVSPALYSIYLELGTRKMEAQSFLDPALRKEWPVLMANIKKMFKR
ncbi:TPA: HK97-gp10 family putative phage morphogenesis protein [Streptococcus pyogenes]